MISYWLTSVVLCYFERGHSFQDGPTPEKEFAEYIFKTEISLNKSPTDTDKTIKEIAKWISALMNTVGGLILLYSNRPDSDRKRDKWLMGFESVLANNWIPESLLQSLIRYQCLETDGQLRIYIFVSKSPNLVTFNCYAFGRRATGVRPIKDSHRIQEMLDESSRSSASGGECSSQMTDLLTEGHFKVNDPIPVIYRESETMEFKHCYLGTSAEKSELPSFEVTQLKHRLGEYQEYRSAFANTHGGSLVLGVEEKEKFPVVRGFRITENQEADEKCITEYMETRLEECIWHGQPGYKPLKGQDWNIFYHRVIEENGKERKMIEVRIAKHSGGMLTQSPVYYVVNGNGAMEEKKRYNEWKLHLHANILDEGNRDVQSHIQKHVERAATETNDNVVETSNVPNVPEDQSQQGISAATSAGVDSKLPKSFKESQSEHKSDIMVQGLSMHDCCTNRMARHIQGGQDDKIWYPSFEHIQKRLPVDISSEKLMTFLQAKEWNGVASVIEIPMESNTTNDYCPLTSAGHGVLCHVLIIRKHDAPLLICCINDKSHYDITGQDLEKLVDYALDSGRVLKRQFLACTANKQHHSCLFHIDVEVLLVPNEGDVQTVWNSKTKQPVTYPYSNQERQYTIACTGLSEELLRTRASVKDRYGQILAEHLTEAQARILLAKSERLLVVNGKSGTGKTVIALNLMTEAMKKRNVIEDVVYVCSNEGLKAFVNSQVPCEAIVVKSTNCLTQSQKSLLENAKLVIVDDVHAIELDDNWETNPGDLYLTLFTHAERLHTRVAVFFDAEQDYMGNLPVNFDKRLRDLAENVPGMMCEDIKIVTLRQRIRNSQEINRFMQANQNQANIAGTIECLNERPGDDVLYEYIGSNIEDSGNILNAKLDVLEKKYEARSVAILCDDIDQLNEMKTLLMEKFHKTFQEDNRYPIEHMVMCSLEDFGGLEAEVILFLLPRNFGTGGVKVSWKYVNVISSRARERLEFLLPWDPASGESGDEEWQGKLTNLLELFKMVRQKKL